MTTLDGIVLLGWMQRADAVNYLQEECVFDPPLRAAQAKALWAEKRDAVRAIEPSRVVAPPSLPLDPEEECVARRFMERLCGSTRIKEILKIDPMDLVVHQQLIVLDIVAEHVPKVATKAGWIRQCLSTDDIPPIPLQMRGRPNVVDAMIPHTEFMFVLDPRGRLGIQEFTKHVSVSAFDGRLLLWSGYHRSYARIANLASDATDRSLLVARTTDGDSMVAANAPDQGLRDTLRGHRPPLFRDFFDERLFTRVKLRKKRFELHIEARLVRINV